MNVTIQGASPKEVRYVMRSFLRVAWSRAKSNDNLTQILHKIFKQCSGGYKNYNSFRGTVYRGAKSLEKLATPLELNEETKILRAIGILVLSRCPFRKGMDFANALWKMCPAIHKNAKSFYKSLNRSKNRMQKRASPTNR